GAATIKPSRKPVTSGDTFSRTSHDRNYSCGVCPAPPAQKTTRHTARPFERRSWKAGLRARE
ncbi:hypothetical protein ACFC0R_40540, partial [Streptomyces sp. NPDC056086]|uniref:hypothetical protein n=1 Tax=Streptomyces sp. NPDC056086 TaxID=3345709 RepID=UPI0035D69F06